MTYEPALFIADAKGVLVERLDAIFDAAEITEAFTTFGVL
jgi:limonene-1,2-epoxide hydrolase